MGLDKNSEDATGLSGGDLRSQLKKASTKTLKMPPACPVEIHARSYMGLDKNSEDAIGLSGGDSRSQLKKASTKTLKTPPACPVEIHARS